jgi:hypothetical protein
MSNEEKIEFANAEPVLTEEEVAAAVPARRGRRRNCMVIPGSSDPMVAKLYSEALMKEVFGSKQEADPENPENATMI